MTQDKKRKKQIRAFAAKAGMSYMAAYHVFPDGRSPPGPASTESPRLIAGFSIDYGHGDLVEDSHDRAKAAEFMRAAVARGAPIAYCSACDLFVSVDHFDGCELRVRLLPTRRIVETHGDRSARERKEIRRRQPADKIATRNLFLPVTKEATNLHRGTGDKDFRNPTLAVILRELAGLPGGEDSDSFVIYGTVADPSTYMQTHGGRKDGFALEYRVGALRKMFASKKLLSLAAVQRVFVWYASGDERWKTRIPWERFLLPGDPAPQPSTETDVLWLTKRCLAGEHPEIGPNGGKWLIFIDRADVDEWWEKISAAVDGGLLGRVAQVSTARPNPNSADPSKHVVCVYSYDYSDVADVTRIRGALRELGVTWRIAYKTNEATKAGKYKVRGDSRVSQYWE